MQSYICSGHTACSQEVTLVGLVGHQNSNSLHPSYWRAVFDPPFIVLPVDTGLVKVWGVGVKAEFKFE